MTLSHSSSASYRLGMKMMGTERTANWHQELGPGWPKLGWAPTPRYLLRRALVMSNLRKLIGGPLLEVGCGSGALLHECTAMGFTCTGLETSAPARVLASRIGEACGNILQVEKSPSDGWCAAFQAVVALEVLEHIEDDVGALLAWRSWLASDGVLLISVPAHRKRWGAADEWAGHVRRYDRADIEAVMVKAGFRIESIGGYGFGLGTVLDFLSQGGYRKQTIRHADGTPNRAANNERSGIDRKVATATFGLLSSLPGRLLMQCAFRVQSAFQSTRLGTGFVVVARKQ